MSDTSTPTVDAKVEDAGPCLKKLSITVPAAMVKDELDSAYNGLTMIEPGSANGAPIVVVGVRKLVDAAGIKRDKLWTLFPQKTPAGTLAEPFDYLDDGERAMQSCAEFNPVLRPAASLLSPNLPAFLLKGTFLPRR